MKHARRLATALAVFAAATLAACSSPSSSITFQPPNTWHPSASILGLGQIWKSPDRQQVLLLMKLPVPMNVKDAIKTASVQDAKVEKQEQIKICGDQPAIYLMATGTSNFNGTKQPGQMDMIMSSTGGATYMALYARPEHQTADAEAESAIRSLCEKKS